MTKELVFNLIYKNKNNLIKIAKAIRTDFEAVLECYIVLDGMPVDKALLRLAETIVEAYEDKMDIWISIQEDLEY